MAVTDVTYRRRRSIAPIGYWPSRPRRSTMGRCGRRFPDVSWVESATVLTARNVDLRNESNGPARAASSLSLRARFAGLPRAVRNRDDGPQTDDHSPRARPLRDACAAGDRTNAERSARLVQL